MITKDPYLGNPDNFSGFFIFIFLNTRGLRGNKKIFFHVTEGTRVVHVRTCRHLQLQQPGIFPTAGQEERLPWVQVIRFEERMTAFSF